MFGSMYYCRYICASEAECVTAENLVTGAFELKGDLIISKRQNPSEAPRLYVLDRSKEVTAVRVWVDVSLQIYPCE